MSATEDDRAAIRRYLAHRKLAGDSVTTLCVRKSLLSRLAAALEPGLLAAAHDDVYAWRASLAAGPSAVINYVSMARGFYTWAIEQGLREGNPVHGVPVPRSRKRQPRPVGEEQLAFAVTTASARIRPMMILAAWCGLRCKEIALLDRADVLDGADPPVLIVSSDAAKGGRPRVIPLSAFVLGELRPVLPGSGYVFRRADGQPGPNQPWRISQLIGGHLHACGFQDTPHSLRHRFGSKTYQAKRDLRVVQDLLGHAHPAQTALYTAYAAEDAREAVESLPEPGQLSNSTLKGDPRTFARVQRFQASGCPPRARRTGRDLTPELDTGPVMEPIGQPGNCPHGTPWCEHEHFAGDTACWADRMMNLTLVPGFTTASFETGAAGPPVITLAASTGDPTCAHDVLRLTPAEAATLGHALTELAGLAAHAPQPRAAG